MAPLLNEVGDLATQDMEKAAVLNAAFAAVFISKTSLQFSPVPETGGKSVLRKTYPAWKRTRSGNT